MTVTGVQFLAAARSFEGEPYSQDPAGRTSPTSGYKDCSGDVVAALSLCGITGVPTVSGFQARWCRDNHTDGVPLDVALATPGVLLFEGANHGYDGFGNDGHAAITIGDKVNVTEARGHAYGVLCDSALGRPWTNAAYVPGLDYSLPKPPQPPKPPVLARELHLTPAGKKRMRGDDVLDVQTKLYGWAFIVSITHPNRGARLNPHVHDGIYGPKTAEAVRAFQHEAGLPQNGIVGPATWASLYRI